VAASAVSVARQTNSFWAAATFAADPPLIDSAAPAAQPLPRLVSALN